MNALQQTMYTGVATSTGGREGTAVSSDGKLNLTLSTPKALGGPGGEGTNPEQLFAAGYSACFLNALKHIASLEKVTLNDNTSVSAEVAIGPVEVGFGLAVKLLVSMGDTERTLAQSLIEKAHQVCPYSNATRNNVDVRVELVD
ncbi:MAG: organic hydroperoxide resistance protein [Xanthomonadales bacterium]|nr:organic hydroperoxide resistance protein [Xanthomonadales bacterium]